ncbi:O-methyltransferase [Fulvivirga ligni]|uniref:O-methyltransferase n=1 Tax=Fulvivirga ligni TaxID=2904246 RepID=UPI001F1B1BB8|nr:class I SAM-dependent methyltransferase [Fulvivirga ligni]UII20030.1 class I SAM-dependent methyltransferase [Fulvivirga ligni]
MNSNKLHQVFSYLDYWLKAEGKHSLQPPFIFDLYSNVFLNKEKYKDFDQLKHLRKTCKKSSEQIKVTDFGSGSQVAKSNVRSISQIATNGTTKPKYSKLLYRLIKHLKANNILELGTSIGLNTLYLSKATEGKVITLEGDKALSNYALDIFKQEKATNIDLITGNIDQTLTGAISEPIDMAFIDANHSYTPTLQYFEVLKSHIHEGSCIIFDDIHWSKEMEAAWNEIKMAKGVTLSIDIFQFGLVFFKTGLKPQHYILEY